MCNFQTEFLFVSREKNKHLYKEMALLQSSLLYKPSLFLGSSRSGKTTLMQDFANGNEGALFVGAQETIRSFDCFLSNHGNENSVFFQSNDFNNKCILLDDIDIFLGNMSIAQEKSFVALLSFCEESSCNIIATAKSCHFGVKNDIIASKLVNFRHYFLNKRYNTVC